MAVTRAKKEQTLNELLTVAAPQKAVVLITTHGTKTTLDSENNFKARKAARSKGVQLKVVKNTLIKQAFAGVPDLEGQTYLAYMTESESTDEVTVPKVIADLLKEDHVDHFDFVGSVVNGEFLDKATTIQLSKTPSYEDSMAMLAGALNQVTAKIAMGVKEIPASVARGVQEYSKQLS